MSISICYIYNKDRCSYEVKERNTLKTPQKLRSFLFSSPVVWKLIGYNRSRYFLERNIHVLVMYDDRTISEFTFEKFSSQVSIERSFVRKRVSREVECFYISESKWIKEDISLFYRCDLLSEPHKVKFFSEIFEFLMFSYRKYFSRVFIEDDIFFYTTPMYVSFICFYSVVGIYISLFLVCFYAQELLDLRYEKSSRTIDMWPEMFLVANLECIWIFRCDTFEDSLILDEIHTAGRVDHLSSYFQCDDRSIDELLLESRYGFYIFDMPVFGRISTLK
jgi:hypothetical protein